MREDIVMPPWNAPSIALKLFRRNVGASAPRQAPPQHVRTGISITASSLSASSAPWRDTWAIADIQNSHCAQDSLERFTLKTISLAASTGSPLH